MAQMPEAIILRKTEETKAGVTYCMADVKTNADRIRAMNDQELAEWIYSINIDRYIGVPVKEWLNWLKQEAE